MTLGSHQRSIGASQTYITPRWIIDRLGTFDLDPCAAPRQPWPCAFESWTADGLIRDWHGRVWLNPPFDRREVGKWISKLAAHGNGIALVHARTETDWFEPVWGSSAILFFAKRITFCKEDGTEHSANSGAPAVLAAWGEGNIRYLRKFDGWLVKKPERCEFAWSWRRRRKFK